ncbi:hypothetical protein DFP72DRAFT_462824 [Ephemerocybe angulata]|uniref:Uncharacterized protein n=1 Tax=Ephemerocybe angulata TaxID=980116 RepID=A0A8H6HRW7_9AGAR|nr:hypothetical protein DFP72DRAFT_462824 [Tulosesus angulatus]
MMGNQNLREAPAKSRPDPSGRPYAWPTYHPLSSVSKVGWTSLSGTFWASMGRPDRQTVDGDCVQDGSASTEQNQPVMIRAFVPQFWRLTISRDLQAKVDLRLGAVCREADGVRREKFVSCYTRVLRIRGYPKQHGADHIGGPCARLRSTCVDGPLFMDSRGRVYRVGTTFAFL